MTLSTTTCAYYNPLHWDTSNTLAPLDSTDPNGTAFQFASSSCTTIYSQSSSTDPLYAGGFTYGEIVLSTLALMLFVVVAYTALWFRVRGIKIRQ